MTELKVMVTILGLIVVLLSYLLYREKGYYKTLMEIKERLADELEKYLLKEAK